MTAPGGGEGEHVQSRVEEGKGKSQRQGENSASSGEESIVKGEERNGANFGGEERKFVYIPLIGKGDGWSDFCKWKKEQNFREGVALP